MEKKWIDNDYAVNVEVAKTLMTNGELGDKEVKLMAAPNADNFRDILFYLETGGDPVMLHVDMTTDEIDDFCTALDAFAFEVREVIEKDYPESEWALDVLDQATL